MIHHIDSLVFLPQPLFTHPHYPRFAPPKENIRTLILASGSAFLRTWSKTVMLYSQWRTLGYCFKNSHLRHEEGNEHSNINYNNSENHPTYKQWVGTSCEYGI